MPSKTPQRTNFISYAVIQRPWALLIGIVALSSAAMGIASLVVLPVVVQSLSDQKSYAPDLTLENLKLIWPWLLLGAMLIFGYATYLGVHFSHRVAGPIWRLEQFLIAKLNGEKPGTIKFRTEDTVGDLPELLNRYFEECDATAAASRVLLNTIQQNLTDKSQPGTAAVIRAAEDLQRIFDTAREPSSASSDCNVSK